MSRVNLMGNDRWSDEDLTKASEDVVRNRLPHDREHILIRRMFALFCLGAPEGSPLRALGKMPSPEQMAELMTAASAFADAEAEAEELRRDAALLHRVLDHEQGIVELTEDDAEGHELLAQRLAARPPEEPVEPDPAPDDPEVQEEAP